MNTRTRIAASALIGAGLLAGGFGVASAVSDDDGNDPNDRIIGSVSAPADPDDQSDAEEDAALEGLATVTPEDASAAAIEQVGGTVRSVELDDEDGFVVYDVEIDTGTGTLELTIDAGDGSILAQESDDED